MAKKTPIGTYIQPCGPHGVEYKNTFYAIQWNQQHGMYSKIPLGLQIMILFLGSFMWINIKPEWLHSGIGAKQ